MSLSFKCEPVQGKDLQPGDLFSVVGEEYWNGGRDPAAVGERLYVRTEAPTTLDSHPDDWVYLVTIMRETGPNDSYYGAGHKQDKAQQDLLAKAIDSNSVEYQRYKAQQDQLAEAMMRRLVRRIGGPNG